MKLLFIIIGVIIILTIIVLYLRMKYPLYLSNDIKSLLYENMEKFDHACRSYNIPYFIVAGSLLGAVRHKGIIPWDDDIDVGIMEYDLERFKQIDWDRYGLKDDNIGINNIGKVVHANKLNNNKKMHDAFIDVFIMKQEGDKIIYSYDYARNMWPKEYFNKEELYPLKKYKFGQIYVSGPRKYLPYCERVWGQQWKKPEFRTIKKILYPIEMLKMRFI